MQTEYLKIKSLYIDDSRNGVGIFSSTEYPINSKICEIKGEIVTSDEVLHYFINDKKRGDNTFRYDAEHYIDPKGEIGEYLNHSCEPNSAIFKIDGKLILKAIKLINVGDEIVIDYSTILGRDDIWTMACNCGTARCRKLITRYDKLPIDTLKLYEELSIIPDYILATIPE